MFAAKNLLLAPKAASGGGVVAYDAEGSGSTILSSAGTAFTWSHTVNTAGATIYADIVSDRSNTLSPVTCDGTAMTLVGTVTLTGGNSGDGFISRYKITGASAVAHTISVTPSADAWMAYGSTSFTGVGSEGAAQTVTGTGTSASQSATCSTGQMILQAFIGIGSSGSLGKLSSTGGTALFNANNSYAGLSIGDASASTAFSCSMPGATYWGGLANALAA